MHTQSHNRFLGQSSTSWLTGVLCFSLGALAFGACAEDSRQVKRSPSRPYDKAAPTQTDTPTVENTEERGEDIRKVCSRKAQTSPDMSRCWMEESERRGAKKFDAEVKLMLMVSPDGKAQEVNVLNPNAQIPQLEACIVDAVKGWSYPTGTTMAPSQCTFLLRPMM